MKRLITLLLLLIAISSCATQKKIIYLQNDKLGIDYPTIQGGGIRLQPSDMVSIVVSSKTPELASVFNMISYDPTFASGKSVNINSANQRDVLCYTVNSDGEIDFPVFGKLEVSGMTKFELSEMIQQLIISSDMIKDPIVTVEFENLSFSTLGEVESPGVYKITKDKTTILEALSASGDLTIMGLRDRVMLTRMESGKLKTYQLDLTSTEIYKSPAFYIQQNDVIYVEPNRVRSNQSTINGNTLRSTSFWMSLTSFILTITVLFTN